MAWRSTAGRPLDSSVKSAPPPVISRTASTGSVSRLFTAWVAPSSMASARRDGTTSAAIMVVAPATRAAMTALKPTAPPPNAAKLLPGFNLQRSSSPLPRRFECRSRVDRAIPAAHYSGTLITLRSCTRAKVPNDDCPKKWS